MKLYKAALDRVVSPVTLRCELYLGFDIELYQNLRLNGVAMPKAGEVVKAIGIIDEWVNKYPLFIVIVHKEKGKPWGRYLATVMNRHGESLNDVLLNSHVVEEIPECEIPDEEEDLEHPPEDVAVEEVPEEEVSEMPEVEAELEYPAEHPDEKPDDDLGHDENCSECDLLEDEDDEELAEDFEEAVSSRRRWRLRRK